MNELFEKYNDLDPDSSEAKIEKTAQDLERRNYMPTLLLDIKDFFHFNKEKMLKEYERVMSLSSDSKEIKSVIGLKDPQEIKIVHLTSLLNQYKLLCSLREGEATAWDTINELYEDD